MSFDPEGDVRAMANAAGCSHSEARTILARLASDGNGQRVLMSETSLAQCTCTPLKGADHLGPAEYEQDPGCVAHGDPVAELARQRHPSATVQCNGRLLVDALNSEAKTLRAQAKGLWDEEDRVAQQSFANGVRHAAELIRDGRVPICECCDGREEL